MAISASMALSSATSKPGKSVTATCTVTNTGGSSVNITALSPLFQPSGLTHQSLAAAIGEPPLGPGMTIAVAGSSGTLALSWDIVAHAPAGGFGLGNPAEFVYDVGATVYTSDGAITDATSTTLTVTPN